MASERFFLVIRAPNGDVREMSLGADVLVLGRDESADIRVDDKKVSRRHAAFKLEGGIPWIEDLGSSNGVRLNGKRIDKKARLTADDKVRVGGFQISLKVGQGAAASEPEPPSRVDVPPTSLAGASRTRTPKVVERNVQRPKEDLPELEALDPPVIGRTFLLHRGENIVGRLEECDVPVLDGSVSRQHARLVFARDRVTVTDLGSSNGVCVNGTRVDMAELADGDELKIGNIRFNVRLPASLAGKNSGPLKTRSRPAVGSGSARRWMLLGLAGLLLAGLVVGGAIYMRTQGMSKKGRPGLLSVGGPSATQDSGLDPAGEASELPDAGAVQPALVAPPPVKAPPVKPRPEVPPTPVKAPPKKDPPAKAPVKMAGGPKLSPTGTATSPFSRRSPQGLPLGLPTVDTKFDFDGFVDTKLAAAQVCEQGADYACLRAIASELLGADPINAAARGWLKRADRFDQAQISLVKADGLVAKGRFGAAYALLLGIADDVPQAADAKDRATKIRQLAIDDELKRAARQSRRASTWRAAHGRYLRVLELDANNSAALTGIRALERKMRKKKVAFPQYEAPVTPGATPTVSDMKAVNAAIVAHYGGNRDLAKVAQAYARGALAKARRRAKKLQKKGPRSTRRRAAQMDAMLKDIKTRYARTRTEISNDPDRAWSMLMQLERVEREMLPQGVQSFLARELQMNLSEAFADRAGSMFDRGRFESAFQGWVSGYKLDGTNPKARAGLARLLRRAETLAQDAELASQRADPSACDKWKQVTRITRANTEMHKKARQRALALCR